MKVAYLEDADQNDVAHAVRRVVEDRGGIVTDHAPSHTTFEGVDTESSSFTKGGYVGTYQHVGERELELRVHTRATVPAKVFWRTVFMEIPLIVLLFALDPHPNVWFAAAVLLYGALIATFLIYLGTWRSSWALDRELLDGFVEELRQRAAAQRVLTEEERAMEEFEQELRAEVTEARLKQKRKRGGAVAAEEGGPRVRVAGILESLRALIPGRKAPPRKGRRAGARAGGDAGDAADGGDAEAKRERLKRLRRELERRKAGADDDA